MDRYLKKACQYYADRIGYNNHFRSVRNSDEVDFWNNNGQSRRVFVGDILDNYQYWLDIQEEITSQASDKPA
jgi:hypothetical protein